MVRGGAGERGDHQYAEEDDPRPQAGRARRIRAQRAGSGRWRHLRAARGQCAGPITPWTAAIRSHRVNGLAITCRTPSVAAAVHDPKSPDRNCPEIAIKGVSGYAALTARSLFAPSWRGMYTSTITRSPLSGTCATPGAAARTEYPSALNHSTRSSRISLSSSMMTMPDLVGSGTALFDCGDCICPLHRSGATPSFPMPALALQM